MFNIKIIWISALTVGLILIGGFWLQTSDVPQSSDVINSPEPSETENPSPTSTPRPIASSVPLPVSDGKTTFIDEAVPWNLLLDQASCRLQGEIKFLNHNTYDNQDALFIYSGVDHPARNI